MEVCTTWEVIPCTLERGRGCDVAIGLIALAGDSVIEAELRAMLPKANVALYATRIPFRSMSSAQTLRAMEGDIPAAAALLVPGEALDVVAFGCTSGAMAIGEERLRAAVHRGRRGIAVTDPMAASVRALAALSFRRIGVLTPYSDEVNRLTQARLTAHGFEVIGATFRAPESVALGRALPTRLSPQAIFDAAVRVARGPVDGLFISCTGLRCSSVIDAIEAATGKPVVTSNQAVAWDCLRLARYRPVIRGQGRLLLGGHAA